ncbi:ATP synthase regulation protein NCA2 [Xylaria nigripes]|nr:ATP synthase regulation protein NCA2 [Xylaria nigripes]
MSAIADQVRRLDAHIDQIIFANIKGRDAQPKLKIAAQINTALKTSRAQDLLRIIKALSATTRSRAVIQPQQLRYLLTQSRLHSGRSNEDLQISRYESELEWLLVSKVAVQTYGIIVENLLDQIAPLSDHIWYWDQVLSSPTSTSLYLIQTCPVRLWAWSSGVYGDSTARLRRYSSTSTVEAEVEVEGINTAAPIATPYWRRFYTIVYATIIERSLADVHQRVMSPIALCRAEARMKQAKLKKLRDMTASGLGILMDEVLVFDSIGIEEAKSDSDSDSGGSSSSSSSEPAVSTNRLWKRVVERSVALMDMMLHGVLDLDLNVTQMEDKIFAAVKEHPLSIQATDDGVDRPIVIAKRLHALLDDQLPWYKMTAQRIVTKNGRPSRLVRYWLPTIALLLSSTTILRILVNRRQALLDWIQDFGATVRGFWLNWVVEPVKKIIGTIRHDANSEIAIMSRDSLSADRESLERMVVDFTLDKSTTSVLSEAEIAEIRAKVREGDVTPILRAYEQDLRTPFLGAVRGNLVRTLLIQVQKTKVDVEVAMSGIDSLLRSQELVFGFVGLTPGILVSVGVARYFLNVLGGRKGFAEKRKAGRCVRVLRNIDRIFSEATPTENNLLTYKDHGLLICEVLDLRRLAHKLLPADIEKDFMEDLNDLANLKGIPSQQRALDRIRWAYSRWLK